MKRRALACLVLAACGANNEAPVPPRIGGPQSLVFVSRGTNGLVQGTLPGALPAGWAWPFDPNKARAVSAGTIYHPVNVAALAAIRAQNPNACTPIEMAPNVWITPLCAPLAIGTALLQRGFPVRGNETRPLTSLPLEIDLRALRLDGAIKDQQMAPVCWSFAFSSVMENALRRAGRADVVSPLHLVSHNDWRSLKNGTGVHGTSVEGAWPFDATKACEVDIDVGNDRSCQDAYGITPGSGVRDPALVAERARADASSVYRISAIQPLSTSPGDPDQFARRLAAGQAVYVEVEFSRVWNNSFHAAGGVIPDWTPDGTGGHAVIISGYRTVAGRRQFLLHNSWGPSWGEDGYGWISEEMIRTRLRDAWTITLSDAQGNVVAPGAELPPVPVPTVAPTTPVPVPVPVAGQCSLNGVFGDGTRVTPRTVPRGESICTTSNAGGESPGEWLQDCRATGGGSATLCRRNSPSAPICVAALIGGRSRAACCPASARTPSDPGCVPADRPRAPAIPF